jgi:hypothetical protein
VARWSSFLKDFRVHTSIEKYVNRKLLDFALLKLDIEKPETAVSKWSRARTRAAKVG